MYYLMMRKGYADVLAIFNYKKEFVAGGLFDEGIISHLVSHPNQQGLDEIFFVPSTTKKMPPSCHEDQVLTLQAFMDLKVIPRRQGRPRRIPEETKARVLQLRTNGVSIRQTAALCDVSKGSVEKIIREAS
ncbi:hypothetical protein imdm_2022 [gamma proteobacterium IMCC2047]|nr:hypothetical protein imdm_2022 [gamma proteobacterium IMCC2047]